MATKKIKEVFEIVFSGINKEGKMEKLAGTIAACGLLLAFVGSAVIVGLLFLPVVVLWTLGYCVYDLMKRKD